MTHLIRWFRLSPWLWLAALAGCSVAPPPNDNANDNTNGNDNSTLPLTVIDSGADVRGDSLIRTAGGRVVGRAGDDGEAVLHLIEPDGTTTVVSADGTSLMNDFVMAGPVIVARGANSGVYAYDATSGTGTAERVGLQLLAAGDVGRMATDGGNIVAFITAEPFICWVDRRDDPLRIRTFAVDPMTSFSHVAVSGSRIAFLDGDRLLVQDTAAPAAPPTTHDVGADPTIAPAFSGGIVIYVADGTLRQLDVDGGGAVTDTNQSGAIAVAISGAAQATFAGDAAGTTARPAVLIAPTVTAEAPPGDDDSRVPAGWGHTLALTDGGRLFVAGGTDPDSVDTDPLSFWQDGAWIEIFDGATPPSGRVAAGQVAAGDGWVAFILGTDAGLRIGYLEVD